MKCVLAHVGVAVIVLPAVGGMIYLFATLPGLFYCFIGTLGSGAAAVAACWSIGTVIECWSQRK